MENKISIEELIKHQEQYSEDYNQYMEYLKSVFNYVFNIEKKDFAKGKEVNVKKVSIYKSNDKNYIFVEYKDINNTIPSFLNIEFNENELNMKTVFDNKEINKRITKNILPIVTEIKKYIDENNYCVERKLLLSDVIIQLTPNEINIKNDKDMFLTHSFRNEISNDNNAEIFMHNNISYNVYNNSNLSDVKNIINKPLIDTNSLPDYLKKSKVKTK